jgi:hypothetical protein
LGPTLDIQIKLRQRSDLEGVCEVDAVEDEGLTHSHLLVMALEEVSHPEDDVALCPFVCSADRLQRGVRSVAFREVSGVAILVPCLVMPFLRVSMLELHATDGARHGATTSRETR